jgi:multidrug efflux pump subunit AcrB
MIDYANKKRHTYTAFEAIHEAGIRRFRPIMLTTLTTFGGLTPIILESSRQAFYLIPMAISLGFGIVFATSIILVIIPCLYMMQEDISGYFGSLRQKLRPETSKDSIPEQERTVMYPND